MRYDLQCWSDEGRLVYRSVEWTQLGCAWTVGLLLEYDQPFTLALIRVVRRGKRRPGQVRSWLIDPKDQRWAIDTREPSQPTLWEVALD